MRTLLIALAVLPTLCAQNLNTFEVKELSQHVIQKLADAESGLDVAMKALAVAQRNLEKAQIDRDAARAEALNSTGVYATEGQCTPIAVTPPWPGVYERFFTRVEIRGKYALITTGKEQCSTPFTMTSAPTALPFVIHGSDWNGK